MPIFCLAFNLVRDLWSEFVSMVDVACEQAPMWGLGRKEKLMSGASRVRSRGDHARLAPLANFSFRPKPHIGACSQAMVDMSS